MLLVVVLETKNKEGSDYIYFKAILNRFYKERGTGISIKPIFMNGKGNYDKVDNKINHLVSQYDGRCEVIYFIDVDNTDLKFDQQQLNRDIINYCEKKNYEIVWYNRTVEDVLLGEIVKKNKTEMAYKFFDENKINTIDEELLSINKFDLITIGKSNVKYVLDKYLIKK